MFGLIVQGDNRQHLFSVGGFSPVAFFAYKFNQHLCMCNFDLPTPSQGKQCCNLDYSISWFT